MALKRQGLVANQALAVEISFWCSRSSFDICGQQASKFWWRFWWVWSTKFWWQQQNNGFWFPRGQRPLHAHTTIVYGLQYTSACKAQYNVQRRIYVHANITIYGGTIHHIVQKVMPLINVYFLDNSAKTCCFPRRNDWTDDKATITTAIFSIF